MDVCRWALDVDYPNRVTSTGGRYAFKDDWQFYDTLTHQLRIRRQDDLLGNKCCKGMRTINRDRGSLIEGTNGTVMVDRDGYEIYDLKGKKTGEFKVGAQTSTADLIGARLHD